jgi:enediyne biosynthesis protein E4
MRIINALLLAICCVTGLCFLSCQDKKRERSDTLFTLLDSTGINFRNTVVDTRLDNSFYFRNFYNGGGVAIGDINNDGLSDVLLSSNMGENKLYLNKGDLKFEDITALSGMRQDSMWSTGVTMVDVNNDGWLDMYICNSGHINDGNRRNKLYINNHDLSFTESAKKYGLDHSGFCTQASFFDYDLDGDLDCFIINNSPLPFSSLNYGAMRDTNITEWNVDDNLKGGGNHLYRNDNNYFTEVTKDAGLHTGLISFGLGISVGDLNGDDYPDVYVGNDFIEKDYLYINQKNGTFRDELESRLQQISMSSMSSDLGDINNDGHYEILTTDMIPDDDYRLKTTGTFDNIDLYISKQKAGLYHQYVKNCLQLNNQDGSFSEIGNYCGISGTDWSWGAVFFDADNDGLNDIFICNGINKDVGNLDFLDFFSNDVYKRMLETGKREEIDELLKQIPVTPLPNRVFKNKGNLQFTDIGKTWGLDQPGFSNSIAYGDLDNDGDLDVVINNENQPAFVYRNNATAQTQNNFVGVLLEGKGSNTSAIGAKIKLYKNGEIYGREVVPVRGFQSSVDYKQIIGVGNIIQIDSMIVIWPDREYTKYDHPELNKVHILKQPDNAMPVTNERTAATTLLERLSQNMDRHVEDEHIDFYYERNLPEMLSKEGPHITRADVNGDGLEDIYIGGARNRVGQLYMQTASGFARNEQAVFKSYSDFEDVAVLFFDADKDNDMDLFIGSGGNNRQPGSRELQHRLYKNDGKGNFAIDTKAFPANDMNIGVAAADDYDTDGDMDLFVGSRSVPYHYGITPRSYLYRNDGSGHFTDEASKMNPDLSGLGMITGALWADINGDAKKELIITGQFMPTKIFGYNRSRDKFEEFRDTKLQDLYGWWHSIAAADINGDSKTDLIIGNIGENFYLRPGRDNPVKLWINDFDHDGTSESVLSKTISGKNMPVFLKRELTDQFPALKKESLKHSDYAGKTVEDLFGKELLYKTVPKQFNYCQSIVAINDGKGAFTIRPLPVMVQLSSVHAIEAMDINNDTKIDLVMGGNSFGFPPQFGKLDGSYGHVLLNNGNGNFNWVAPQRSGMSLKGCIKDIKEIKNKDKRYILVVQNDEWPVLYRVK